VGSNERSELRLGKPMKSETMMNFAYVYILQSLSAPEHYYVGFTQDLHEGLRRHNSGEVPHTSKFRPWRIKPHTS
jgi:predicted GIY-YIG superfamily endonuclease